MEKLDKLKMELIEEKILESPYYYMGSGFSNMNGENFERTLEDIVSMVKPRIKIDVIKRSDVKAIRDPWINEGEDGKSIYEEMGDEFHYNERAKEFEENPEKHVYYSWRRREGQVYLATEEEKREEEERNIMLEGDLDLTDFTQLKKLILTEHELTSIKPSVERYNLTEIIVFKNQLTSLNINGCSNLKKLVCFANQLTSLDVSRCRNLEELSCFDNQLTSLDLSNCPKLTVLRCGRNQLTNLDLRNNQQLEIITLGQNKISVDLDIFAGLTKLKELILSPKNESVAETASSSLTATPETENENDFSGNLISLKTSKELKIVSINNQKNIRGNLESLLYILGEKLEHFYCQGTDYQNILELYGYTIKEWKSYNVTDLEKQRAEEAEKSDSRIVELENELEIEKDKGKVQDD